MLDQISANTIQLFRITLLFLLPMYPMLYASVYHNKIDRLSIKPTQSLIRYPVFSRLSKRDGKLAWFRYGSISVKCLFQTQNDALPSLGTEPRVDNLEVANLLRLYPLSCTIASRDVSVKRLFQEHNSALCRVWASN